MPKIRVEIGTDENGYFSRTVPFNPPGPIGLTIHLSATLLSPFATGIWGALDIDARDGAPSNAKRAFVAWHSEAVRLGEWKLDGGDNIIVVTGKTNPRRPNARLLLEIDAAI
jgi:hypothetical protein